MDQQQNQSTSNYEMQVEIPIRSSFDGGFQNNKFQLDEYPPGYDPNSIPNVANPDEQIEQSVAPIGSRLISKIFKQRQSAYEELTSLFNNTADQDDEIFSAYSSQFHKYMLDNNPMAQEKAIRMFLAWLKHAKRSEAYEVQECTKCLVDKCLGSPKPLIQSVAKECLIAMFQKHRNDVNGILEGLLSALQMKNQKTVINALQTINDSLVNFGMQKLNMLNLYWTEFEACCGSSNATIRQETLRVYKEAFLWAGEWIKQFLVKLKKPQQDELEAYFKDNAPGKKIPLIQIVNEDGTKEDLSPMELPDLYDSAEAVDLFDKKYTECWGDKLLAEAKWQDKKDMLDSFNKEALGHPKLQGNVYPLTGMLKRVLSDSNINVVISGIKMTGIIAKGMRKGFAGIAKQFFQVLLQKFKDKKTNLIDETRNSLLNFMYCLQMDEVVEYVKEVFQDKNPVFKINTINWLSKFLDEKFQKSKEPKQVIQKQCSQPLKLICASLKSAIDDPNSEVRDSAINLMARLCAYMGEQFIMPFAKDLQGPKFQKLQEASKKFMKTGSEENNAQIQQVYNGDDDNEMQIEINQGTAQCQLKGKPLQQNKQMLQQITQQQLKKGKQLQQNDNLLQPNTSNKPIPCINNNNNNNQKQLKLSFTDAESVFNVACTINTDTAEAILETTCSDVFSILQNFTQTLQWKDKAALIQSLTSSENVESLSPEAVENIIIILKEKLKDWKEKNINIVKETFALLLKYAESQFFLPSSFALIAPFIIESLTESKCSELISALVVKCCEQIVPKFIQESLMYAFKTHCPNQDLKKALPRNLECLCQLFTTMLNSLTLQYMDLASLLEMCKLSVQSTLQPTKQAGTSLIIQMNQFFNLGVIDALLKDLPQSILKSIQKEMQTYANSNANSNIKPNCKVQFNESINQKVQQSKTDLFAIIESMIPRQDIGQQMAAIQMKLQSTDWKEQKEAIDNIEKAIVNAGGRVLIPNNVSSDLTACLKAGLRDKKNKALVRSYVQIVGKLCVAVGKDYLNTIRQLVPLVMTSLADKQQLVRSDTTETLNQIQATLGYEIVLNNALALLTQTEKQIDSIDLKVALLQLLAQPEVSNEIFKKLEGLKGLVSPIMYMCLDKNKDVRKYAEEVMIRMMRVIDSSIFYEKTQDMKQAIQNTVHAILQKIQKHINDESQNMDFDDEINNNANNDLTKANMKQKPINNAKGHVQLQQIQQKANVKQQIQNQNNNANMIEVPCTDQKMSTIELNLKKQQEAMEYIQMQQKQQLQLQQQPPKSAQQQVKNIPKSAQQIMPQQNLQMQMQMQMQQQQYNQLNNNQINQQSNSRIEQEQEEEAELNFEVEKVKRLEGDRLNPWPLSHLSDSHIQTLREHCTLIFNDDTAARMFSYNVSMLAQVAAFIQEQVQGENVIHLSDILLKWCFLHARQGQIRSHLSFAQSLGGLVHHITQTMLQLRYRLSSLEEGMLLLITYEMITAFPSEFFQWVTIMLPLEEGLLGRGKMAQFWLESTNRSISEWNQKLQYAGKIPNEQEATVIKGGKLATETLYKIMTMNFQEYRDKLVPMAEFLFKSAQEELPKQIISQQIQQQQQQQSCINVNVSKSPPQKQLDYHSQLVQLVNSNQGKRMTAMMYIQNLLQSPETTMFSSEQVSFLIDTLIEAITFYTREDRQCVDITYIEYFLSQLVSIYNSPKIAPILQQQPAFLFKLIDCLMKTLVYEDSIKSSVPLNYIKPFNSYLIKVLEVTEPVALFTVLFDLLMRERMAQGYNKLIGLLLKCLDKAIRSNHYDGQQSLFSQGKVVELLLFRCHLYLCQFFNANSQGHEDLGIKTMRLIINCIYKNVGAKILDFMGLIKSNAQSDNIIMQEFIVKLLNGSNDNDQDNQNFSAQTKIIQQQEQEQKMQTVVVQQITMPDIIKHLDEQQVSILAKQLLEQFLYHPENIKENAANLYSFFRQNPQFKKYAELISNLQISNEYLIQIENELNILNAAHQEPIEFSLRPPLTEFSLETLNKIKEMAELAQQQQVVEEIAPLQFQNQIPDQSMQQYQIKLQEQRVQQQQPYYDNDVIEHFNPSTTSMELEQIDPLSVKINELTSTVKNNKKSNVQSNQNQQFAQNHQQLIPQMGQTLTSNLNINPQISAPKNRMQSIKEKYKRLQEIKMQAQLGHSKQLTHNANGQDIIENCELNEEVGQSVVNIENQENQGSGCINIPLNNNHNQNQHQFNANKNQLGISLQVQQQQLHF